MRLVAAALLFASPVQAFVCTADTQCRGDALSMCAPSALRIEVAGDGRLWIDHQGPYPAGESREGAVRLWSVEAFGSLVLRVGADGDFVYVGNRGKRFSGRCEGM